MPFCGFISQIVTIACYLLTIRTNQITRAVRQFRQFRLCASEPIKESNNSSTRLLVYSSTPPLVYLSTNNSSTCLLVHLSTRPLTTRLLVYSSTRLLVYSSTNNSSTCQLVNSSTPPLVYLTIFFRQKPKNAAQNFESRANLIIFALPFINSNIK